MPPGIVQKGDSLSPIGESTFSDIDGDGVLTVESVSITRGRRDELERTPTGTCTILLNSRILFTSSMFDALQVQVRLWNPVLNTWTVIFRGTVKEASWDYDPSQRVARIEVVAVDLLDYLAGYELDPVLNGDSGLKPGSVSEGDVYYIANQVDERITAALDDAEVPAASRDIFTGNVNVQRGVYPPRTSVLEVMQDAAEAEWPGVANIYVSKAGVVTFHGRRARFFPDVAEYDIDEWTIGDHVEMAADPTGTAQIRGLSYIRDQSMVINSALATPEGIDDEDIQFQFVTDSGSIVTHGLHSWSAENLLTAGHKLGTTDALEETRLFAQYYVDNYAAPRERVTNLVVKSLRPTDPRAAYTWRVLTEIEISDIIHVMTSYQDEFGAQPALQADYFVEGIRYEIRPLTPDYDDVTMTLDLSPAEYYTTNPFEDDEAPS